MIDFIPVSEYAHYFDVTVLCMVLTAVWQCHTGSVLKKETVSLNAMWGVLFTLILILYMGLRPVSVYFGDTVNYAKGFYTAANSCDPFSWQWEGEWLFHNLMQWFAKYSDIHTFFLLCATVYIRFIVAGHATYLQRVLLYSFFSHTQHVYFLELRSKWHPEWHGSLLVHLGNDVCQPSTCNDRVMRVGSRNPQIHLSDGWSRHTDLVHQKQLLVSGRMGGMCRRIVCRRRTYPSIFGGNKSNGGRQPLFRLSDR